MMASLGAMVAIELAKQLPDMLQNLLPGMLPELLRIHLSDTLRGQDSQSSASHRDDDDDNINCPPLPLITQYVQPLVLAHLPGLVQKCMDENFDMDDVVAMAEINLADVGDSAIIGINEAKEECLNEIAAAEADARDRLRDVFCDGDEVCGLTPEEQEDSPGSRAERMAALGRGLPQESNSQGSSFRFRRRGSGRSQEDGAGPVLVEQTQPRGHRGQQQHPGAQPVREATTAEDHSTTDEDDTNDEDDTTDDEEDNPTDAEDDMTDRQDDAAAGHDGFGSTTPQDFEPGPQDEGNWTHELIQNDSINAAGGTGHNTAAAPPFWRPSVHSQTTNQGGGDTDGEQMETDCTPTQEDSNNSGLVDAYRRSLHAMASAFAPSTARRSRSPEVRQPDSSLSRPDMQTSGNHRSAASTHSQERNCSNTQFQYAQVVDNCFSVPSDRSSSAQPDSELEMREDP